VLVNYERFVSELCNIYRLHFTSNLSPYLLLVSYSKLSLKVLGYVYLLVYHRRTDKQTDVRISKRGAMHNVAFCWAAAYELFSQSPWISLRLFVA